MLFISGFLGARCWLCSLSVEQVIRLQLYNSPVPVYNNFLGFPGHGVPGPVFPPPNQAQAVPVEQPLLPTASSKAMELLVSSKSVNNADPQGNKDAAVDDRQDNEGAAAAGDQSAADEVEDVVSRARDPDFNPRVDLSGICARTLTPRECRKKSPNKDEEKIVCGHNTK